jgi:hypothetical protein
MKASIQTFRAGIGELSEFLTSTEHQTELIGLLLQRENGLDARERQLVSNIALARTDRKRYVYTVAIVSLYGLLEQFIDTCVEAFIVRIARSVKSYEAMPEAVRRNHVFLSTDLLKAISEERGRRSLTVEGVIANLHSCLSGAPNFRINGSAFVLHRGNVTLSRITSYLASVGVDTHLRKVSQSAEFVEYFRNVAPERSILAAADQELPAIFDPIDDLVSRRNQVSHGSISIDDIESTELLKERCRFVTAYCGALYEVLVLEALRYQVAHSAVQRLGRPIAVYDNSIVCFESGAFQIAVGSIVAAETGNNVQPFRYGPISSLQIDGQPVDQLLPTDNRRFGARVPFRAGEEFEYYVLPEDCV